jgi:very-short-patch-repair endonuclease
VDHFVYDPETKEAVIEWTHFKPKLNGYLRGDEWYRFDEQGLITEIRAYYACPASRPIHEIDGYAYQELDYPVSVPDEAHRRQS